MAMSGFLSIVFAWGFYTNGESWYAVSALVWAFTCGLHTGVWAVKR